MESIEFLLMTLSHINTKAKKKHYLWSKHTNSEYLVKVESQEFIHDLYSLCMILELTIHPGEKWEYIVG